MSENFRGDFFYSHCIQNLTTQRERAKSVKTPILFAVCGPKVHQTKCACVGDIAVCNAVFYSTDDYFVSFWRYLRSSSEVVRNLAQMLTIWGSKIFWGSGPKFQTQFYKLGLSSNMSKFNDARLSDLGD